MIHIKTFLESQDWFTSEPSQLSYDEFRSKTQGKKTEYFSKEEMSQIVDLLESNGYKHLNDNDEDGELTWMEHGLTGNYFKIGLSNCYFSIKSEDDNPHRIEVTIRKFHDEWWYVVFFQEEYDGDDYFGDYDEYWECDSFEPLIPFLKKNCKFK